MGFFQRALLLYFCLAVAICFAMPSVIFGGQAQGNTVLSWFNIECSGSCLSSNDISYNNGSISQFSDVSNSTASGTFGSPSSPTASQGILGFIDPIFQVFNWVILIFRIIFSPIILMSSAAMVGAPVAFMFVLGIPLVFLFIVGLIIWIRSGFP